MNPLALSASGAALAVLIGVVVVFVLYLLKPPLRRFVVPSSLIWDRVLKQTHAGRDRLRWWLSVLLAALIAAAIIVAIARPELIPTGAGGGKLILVLDNSPTMATRATDGVSRHHEADRHARVRGPRCGHRTSGKASRCPRRHPARAAAAGGRRR